MQTPETFQDRVRRVTQGLMSTLGGWLWAHRIHPDSLTIAGLVFVLIAAFFIARGQFQMGGIILILGLPLDALDGATARAMGRTSKFGGILDSSLDRYADGLIFGGLAYYFATTNEFTLLLVAMAALIGSFATSYVRARAGEADLSIKIGLMDRLVRLTLILVGLVIPSLLIAILWILAIGGNFTFLQRLLYARRQLE